MGASCSAPVVLPLQPQLPRELQARIWELLPVDARVCLASMSRAWRAALAPPALWEALDLSVASGVRVRVTDAALRAASARARGTLRLLNLDGAADVSLRAVEDVARANAATLFELRLAQRQLLEADELRALLEAAPALRTLVAPAELSGDDVLPVLRGEPPFAPFVAAECLDLQGEGDAQRGLAVAQALLASACAGRAQQLLSLKLLCVDLAAPGALDAVLDALRACHVERLTLVLCLVPHESTTPALVRLLSDVERCPSDMAMLKFSAVEWRPPVVAQLADALRANTRLTKLALSGMGILQRAAVFEPLLRALAGHASLQALDLTDTIEPVDRAAAGRAIASLVAANAPALEALSIATCFLGPRALATIAAALPANTHLHTLQACCNGANVAAAAAMAPAVRANTSLRSLLLTYTDEERAEQGLDDFGAAEDAVPALRALEALVSARNQADGEGVPTAQ